jgi:hypothetical protein
VRSLKHQVEYMIFANHPVSRETYQKSLANAAVILHKLLNYKFVVGCLVNAIAKDRRGSGNGS